MADYRVDVEQGGVSQSINDFNNLGRSVERGTMSMQGMARQARQLNQALRFVGTAVASIGGELAGLEGGIGILGRGLSGAAMGAQLGGLPGAAIGAGVGLASGAIGEFRSSREKDKQKANVEVN